MITKDNVKNFRTSSDILSALRELNEEEDAVCEGRGDFDAFYVRKNEFAVTLLQGIMDGSIKKEGFVVTYDCYSLQNTFEGNEVYGEFYINGEGVQFEISGRNIKTVSPKLYDEIILPDRINLKIVDTVTQDNGEYAYVSLHPEQNPEKSLVRYLHFYNNLPESDVQMVLDKSSFLVSKDGDRGQLRTFDFLYTSAICELMAKGISYEQAHNWVENIYMVYDPECGDDTFHTFSRTKVMEGLGNGFDIAVIRDYQFDLEQMHEIAQGINSVIPMNQISIYADPRFDDDQMRQIRMGLEEKLDVSQYADPKFRVGQMCEIRRGVESRIGREKIEVYAKPKFDYNQMREIRKGFEAGVDAEKYADPELPYFKMEKIREGMEGELKKPTGINAKLDSLEKQQTVKSTGNREKSVSGMDNR